MPLNGLQVGKMTVRQSYDVNMVQFFSQRARFDEGFGSLFEIA